MPPAGHSDFHISFRCSPCQLLGQRHPACLPSQKSETGRDALRVRPVEGSLVLRGCGRAAAGTASFCPHRGITFALWLQAGFPTSAAAKSTRRSGGRSPSHQLQLGQHPGSGGIRPRGPRRSAGLTGLPRAMRSRRRRGSWSAVENVAESRRILPFSCTWAPACRPATAQRRKVARPAAVALSRRHHTRLVTAACCGGQTSKARPRPSPAVDRENFALRGAGSSGARDVERCSRRTPGAESLPSGQDGGPPPPLPAEVRTGGDRGGCQR